MRIVSGRARGLKLNAGNSRDIRPTADRIKEALFNSLGSMEDMFFIDLFAGSGAMGLEALSRGAKKVIMIEKNPKHCAIIQENFQHVKKALSHEFQCQILNKDVHKISFLYKKEFASADFIFADPPYDTAKDFYDTFLNDRDIAESAKSALLVLEQPAGVSLMETSLWQNIKRKKYASTIITFWRNKNG